MRASMRKMMRRLHGAMFKLPMMLACDEFESFILAYLENELPARQRRVFEIHLKICRECREYLAAYRASLDLMRDAYRDHGDPNQQEIPEDLVKAILAARDV
jgi:anti-sigma factor RsiW